MINRVVLTGRLTRDVDLRYTPSGAAVANFTLAVDRRFTNQAGERESDFINCVMWRKSAENFSNFTRKGSLVGIDGRLQTRSYENQQGQRVWVTEVVADDFSLLESRATTEARPRGNDGSGNSFNNQGNGGGSYQNQNQPQGGSRPAAPAGSGNQSQSNTPSGNNAPQSNDPFNSTSPDPFANNGKQIDISDDDLPF